MSPLFDLAELVQNTDNIYRKFRKIEMQLHSIYVLFSAILILSGCATQMPTPEEIRKADFGPPPSRSEMSAAVKNYISQFLRDPYSAKFSCNAAPVKGWAYAHRGSFDGFKVNFDASRVQYGYLAICSYNAKNGFGAYAGEKSSYFMLVRNSGTEQLLHFANGLKKFEPIQ